MKQYLLSVYQPDGPAPSAEVLEKVSRDLEAVNQELRAAGAPGPWSGHWPGLDLALEALLAGPAGDREQVRHGVQERKDALALEQRPVVGSLLAAQVRAGLTLAVAHEPFTEDGDQPRDERAASTPRRLD
jgi:hypothetical protein